MTSEKEELAEEDSDEVAVPDMELDFHIQFPTPGYDEAVKGEKVKENEFSTEKIWPIPGHANKTGDEEKEVVVVLLGWAGAEHKHLQKYSDIYLKRGCIVLRYIAPVKALFVQPGNLTVLAHRLIRLIQDLQLESNPIFFHVFSNGGAFMYSAVLTELYKLQSKYKTGLDIRGTILDSAPAPRNLGKCFKAVSSIFDNFGMLKYLIAFSVVIMIILQVFWVHLKSAFQMCFYGEQLNSLDPVKYTVDEIPLRNWIGRICKMRNHNYLFIYSDADDLIPCELVEEIADIASTQKGNSVIKKKFLDSLHVQHYRQYPKEYLAEVSDFIRGSMKAQKNSTTYWNGV